MTSRFPRYDSDEQMGILGLGVDVVHLPRIIRLTEESSRAGRFARRILSNSELIGWHTIPCDRAERSRYLAVRWSLKEAVYKAVFPHIRPTWKDFTFHPLALDGTRKPTLEYHPINPDRSLGTIHCSVSHDGDYVFTSVVVETP